MHFCITFSYCSDLYNNVENILLQTLINKSNSISKINQKFASLLEENNISFEQEFVLGNRKFDFKIENMLIEINPSYTHNSTIGCGFNGHYENPLSKNYHLEKSKLAIENGFFCIHVFDWDNWDKVINLLYLYPNGVNTRSTEIDGLVESSTNLGVLTTTECFVEYDSAVRSSVPSLKEEIVLRSKTIVNLLGGELECTSGYPAWEYNPDSKMREICQSVHKEMYGKEAEIVASHAGVECGLFNEKLGNLDMISFGPNLYDVHTPEEHMSISSVKNCYEYLLNILKAVK